ncbi:MAG: hypothetical protein KGD63_13250 [Candidatus Lokiarchaeota archaeon]|nr:hypothetical protein [Candidatus Lokiarchaeota archaeon]
MGIQSNNNKDMDVDDVFQKKEIVSEKLDDIIINVLEKHNLDVRGIELSPDGKYLLSCSENLQGEIPKVLVWNMEELLEKENTPECILEGELIRKKDSTINNWLLCIDSIILKVNNENYWCVCAGSISGDIYIWFGKIDNNSENWIFENINSRRIPYEFNKLNSYTKAIFDMDVLENPLKNNSFRLFYIQNNIHTINRIKTNDNTISELEITIEENNINTNEPSRIIGNQDEWIMSIDTYLKENFLISGSRDGTIYKWDLNNKNNLKPILIGKHPDAITCVKIFKGGNQIISSSMDNSIRIWENNNNNTNKPNLINELKGHRDAVVYIDIQRNDQFLYSISKDNTMKIWDIDKNNWIRNVDINYYMEKYDRDDIINEKGMIFLRKLKISRDNRHIFTTRHNKIIILRDFGLVWHFIEQLKFIKNNDKDLYRKIYGENLRQLAEQSPENIESLEKIYGIIRKRIMNATELKFSLKNIDTENFIKYNMRELGSLFVPSFINFEIENKCEKDQICIKNQKEYTSGIKDNYNAYWYSVKNLLFRLPDTPWSFRLFVTTDIEDDIEDSNFIEITDSQILDSVFTIMKDRGQTQIKFLLILNNIEPAFIPLISNLNIDVEDDRGDKDNLAFSDFIYSRNFIKILDNPRKSLENHKILKNPQNIYYSDCLFQIDEGYSTEKTIDIIIRKISVEFVDKLNPLEYDSENDEDCKLFNAFRNNFQYPIIPKINIKIGKGIASTAGKIIDDYFAKIIIIEFLFSIWGFMEAFMVDGFHVNIPSWVPITTSSIAFILIGTITLFMIKEKL